MGVKKKTKILENLEQNETENGVIKFNDEKIK